MRVEKNGVVIEVRDKNQLAAFVNNGWKAVEETTAPPEQGEGEGKKYTKTDISRMKVEDLKALASELEIEVAEDATGDKLKEEIIAKLGL